MCGLTGILLHPSERSPETWREIIDIHTANFVFNEERGRDASGLAVIQADGRHRVFKQPVKASNLIEMKGYQDAISTVDNQTVCILGHTRMPTKGSRLRNTNNHPIQAGHVIGVHNGVISNDDDLFNFINLPRAGEVDSEIIFRLLDTVDPLRWNGQYLGKVRGEIDRLEGAFATLSVDLRHPEQLLVLKYRRPLCLHYEADWQALFFSSRYVFLRKAFGRQVSTETLDSGFGFTFDAHQLPQNGNRPIQRFEIKRHNEMTPLSAPTLSCCHDGQDE
jgi:amidophosphoribosyltransferase